MKNLITKALGIAGITALSFLPLNGKGQTSKSYVDQEGDKAYANLEKGMEVSAWSQVAIAYFDSSFKVFSGKYTRKEVIECLNLSLDYLEKSEVGLNAFIKKSKNYQLYENKKLSFSMSFESRVDTNEVKQLLPKIKDLEEIEAKMLRNPDIINELSLDLLEEKYKQTYEMINKFSEREEYPNLVR